MNIIHFPQYLYCDIMLTNMKPLLKQKELAIRLRKKGLSYKEILVKVPVAKSSLSLWLKNLPLTTDEKRSLKFRKDKNISHGRMKAASELMKNRIAREKNHVFEAKDFFTKHIHDHRFLLGIALYWAEGSKRSNAFQFINSDENMNIVMFQWIQNYLGIHKNQISLRLYIHKPYAHENCEDFWAKKLNCDRAQFSRTIYKPTGLLIKKRSNYKGCLRMDPKGGVKLFRYIRTWQECLIDYLVK